MNAGRVYLDCPNDQIVEAIDGYQLFARVDAWSLIGPERYSPGAIGRFRLVGGRAFYDEARLWIGTRDRVLLRRIDEGGRVIRRLVEPDAEIEVYRIDGDAAEALGWLGPITRAADGRIYREAFRQIEAIS